MVTFGVLGPLQARTEAGLVDLAGPRQQSVLARLLVARGHVVAADRIVSDLWRDEPPPRAQAALQAYVSHLRRGLEPDRPPRAPARLLVTAPPGYALRTEVSAVDGWIFEDLVRDAAQLSTPDRALPLLDRALALWRGPAFGAFADEPWAHGEAQRLEELRLDAIEKRAAALLGLGRADAVIPELRAFLADYPLREESWRLLATALYRTGRQGDALESLRTARAVLADELGTDPGPTLRRLEIQLLNHALPDTSPTRPSRRHAKPRRKDRLWRCCPVIHSARQP
ncbi:AfsR/SARP family transcriptional regulator [Allorhizocola rhizosphaerae]|uniref:AfsR/SARP family transcriptional regulator n=1 Tax=Allorhizocola rhizosphaerae TaxID=1872709 RepID=UPI000E3B9AFE|nr:BTAD domain-containing putative transcriptional regulator [Allorhizocola rhizosphaerae]